MADTNNRITTKEMILSYPQLFVAKAPPRKEGEAPGEPQFSLALCGTDPAERERLSDLLDQVGIAKWGDAQYRKHRKSPSFKFAVRTDVDKYESDPRGIIFFLNARSKQKPGVVSTVPDEDGKPTVITDPEKLYPGCIVRASLSAFAYDRGAAKGCSYGLNNVQLIRGGERLDTKVDARDDFEADLTQAPASIDDLTT